MVDPVFVETSEGLVNLSLVRYVFKNGDIMRLVFDNDSESSDCIELSAEEWGRIRGKIGHLVLE